MFRRALLVLLAALFLGALVACGGGGGGGGSASEESDGTEPSEQSEIGDAASADAPAEPEESGPGAEDAGALGDVAGESSESAAEITFTGEGGESFCSQMIEIQTSFESAEPSGATYSALATKIAAVTPPPELEADWPFFVEMNNALAADPTGDVLSGTGGEENAQRFGEVSTKVSEYMTQVCGL
jgi:hypothetical protein